MTMKATIAVLLSLTLTSCVTVPRDAGMSEVRTAVTSRGGGAIEVIAPTAAGDPRVASMLQDELTPDLAVAVAMQNNPRLQMMLADLGLARADLIEASTLANPLLELELRFPGDPYRPYELRLAQTLIDLVQLPRRRALGRAAFDAAQMRVSSEILRFGGDVRSTYFDVVAATQHVALARTVMTAAQTAVDVAMKQHAAQNITDLDLENEQALYEQAKLDLSRAELRLTLAREALGRALGLRTNAIAWRVQNDFPSLPASDQLQAAVDQRLDVAIARRDLEIARGRVPLARLAVLEGTEVDVHYEREPDGARTIGPGIQIPIPIFGGGRAARVRAEAEFLRARHALVAIEAEAASQVRAALANLHETRARVEYYRDVVIPRRGRIVELTKLEHNAMLVGVFQLLQAKQNDLQARRDFIDVQRDYWSARIDADRALQGIDVAFERDTDPISGKRATTARGGH